MPIGREIFELKNFDYGTIKRADPLDIPVSAASDSNNVDGDAPEGRLQGIPTAVEMTRASEIGYNAKRSAWIIDSNGKWNLVYVHGDTSNAINVIADFYNATPADAGVTVAYNAYSFVVHNQECHIGCGTSNSPQWAGYCNYTQLGGSTVGWIMENAEIPQVVTASTTGIAVSAIAGSGTGTVFDANKTYIYRASMIYDYVQESPLDAYGVFGLSGAGGYATHDVTISIINGVGIPPSKRLTGCKLYRAEQDNINPTQVSLYRLIKQFDITGALTHTGYTWTAGGTPMAGYHITWSDDNSIVGATYEQETGIAETLTSNSMKYTLNCEANNSMFVAGCAKTEIPDASHMIFKSMPYRYDMFNWSAVGTYLRLPTQPTALATFNNRIWAFDENNVYKINPDSVIVEETIFGIGCLSQRGILVTPYGMFWCDEKNAYWHDGQTITPIGDIIKADTGAWHGFSTNYATDKQDQRPIVVFSPVKTSVLFIIPLSSGTDVTNVWTWHCRKKRWDAWTTFTPDCGSSCGAYTGKDGEVYVGDGISKLYNSLGGSDRRAWYWTSKDLDLDSAGQYKKFYYLYSRTVDDMPTLNYGADGGSLNGTFTTNKFNNSNVKAKTMKLKVTGTQGGVGGNVSSRLDALEIVFRRMEDAR